MSEVPVAGLDPTFAAYDRDGSEGLSPAELAWIPDPEIVELIETLPSRSGFGADAVSVLAGLPPHKAFRVLNYLEDGEAARLFFRMSTSSLGPTVDVLIAARESHGEPEACRGRAAATWLSFQTSADREFWLGVLDAADPDFSRQIRTAVSDRGFFECSLSTDAEREVSEVREAPVPASGEGEPSWRILTTVNRSRTTVVPMRAYAMADAAERSYLLTADVSTCTVLSLYDPETRTGVLAHFDIRSDLHNSLDRLLAGLAERGIPSWRLKARIAGGNSWMEGSRVLQADLRERLAVEGVRLGPSETANPGDRSRSFALDLASGELFLYSGPYHLPDAHVPDPSHPGLLLRVP